ncbi:hypothetical protein J6590_070972 [Homalodisca vitripennis]|nr:hypothetical protein J6590_070972 [Homalodisca vitripennis]
MTARAAGAQSAVNPMCRTQREDVREPSAEGEGGCEPTNKKPTNKNQQTEGGCEGAKCRRQREDVREPSAEGRGRIQVQKAEGGCEEAKYEVYRWSHTLTSAQYLTPLALLAMSYMKPDETVARLCTYRTHAVTGGAHVNRPGENPGLKLAQTKKPTVTEANEEVSGGVPQGRCLDPVLFRLIVAAQVISKPLSWTPKCAGVCHVVRRQDPDDTEGHVGLHSGHLDLLNSAGSWTLEVDGKTGDGTPDIQV